MMEILLQRNLHWDGVFVGKSSKGQVEEVLGFAVYSPVGRERHEGSGSVPTQPATRPQRPCSETPSLQAWG